MRLTHSLTTLLAAFVLALNMQAQKVQGYVHQQSASADYVWPTDARILQNLDNWQDRKFGVLFHWGIYSVPGIVESWSICSEDVDWITRPEEMTYEEYKQWYFGLKDQFNPVRFNPDQWAEIMHDAGMKYVIFTTKHHDGFCMFDSRYTDFSIAHGPFRNNPRKDVARHVFDAFRKKDFMIGCYFSKPDWHCPWFWSPNFATPDRHPNYKRNRHPEWWKKYVQYTQNQLDELLTRYGTIDILWLDGGWIPGHEIGLDSVLAKARRQHPGLIAVDRTIRGKNENYQTPELSIPKKQLNYPWESCITLSNAWGWAPDATYKPASQVIATLIEIVAKGGCYLLGIGPSPDGTIEQPVIERLQQVGAWLKKNGEAIYATRPTPLYHDGNIWFTAHKDGHTLYALYIPQNGEPMPETLRWTGNVPKGKMTLLANGKRVSYQTNGQQVTVRLPEHLPAEPLALRFQKAD